MSRKKKHTHQTKSEARAEAEVIAADVVQNGETPAAAADNAPTGRVQQLLKTAEEMAKSRLAGTRAELLLDGLPARIEAFVDAALDRVGLVRKSKLEGARAEGNTDVGGAEAQPAE